MYKVNPISVPTLWGDQRLYDYSGDKTYSSIGTLFSVCGIEQFNCVIENQEEVTTLKEKVEQNPSLFGLLEGEQFPVIVAFDSCKDNVSFQIHPTDSYAKEKLSLPYGKSEAWYFLNEPDSKWIYAQTNTNKENVQKAVDEKRVEDVIARIEVSNQDCIYIRSGTIHALTKGALIYEIQQATNITYRFYDYDRIDPRTNKKRDLHLQESFDNLDCDARIIKQHFSLNSQADFREFSIEHTILNDSFLNPSNLACVISVLRGKSSFNGIDISQGQSVIVLPHEKIFIQDEVEVMVAFIQDYFR
ncbi:class I mannose-6-phosphate isomerase [Floccifex sp.]|uniref:class I mannose-6-phosphate isomerase n=1 Tax=Floccifex sp. TaxID=2815810 RepID=UPI003F078E17